MDKDQIIIGLRQENRQLQSENQELRKQLLQDNMERAIRDEELSAHIMEDIGHYYKKPVTPWFVCILFFGAPSVESTPKQPIISPRQMIANKFGPVLVPFGQPLFLEVSGTIICLLNANVTLPEEDSRAANDQYCEALQASLEEAYHQFGRDIGISSISLTRLSDMKQGPRMLYRTAIAVSEKRHTDSPPVLRETASVPFSSSDMEQVFPLETQFWWQIQQHSFYDAAVTLEKLIELANMEFVPLDRVQASVFSRMEAVLLAASQETGRDIPHDPTFSRILPSFRQVKTFQRLCELSYDMLALLEDYYYTKPETRNKKMPFIEQYINTNYSDQQLSATSIAETFKISPQYLSKIFKADMGMGIVDYIHRIRINAAKKQLQDSSDNLDDIAVQSGFTNRWVFIRVFKSLEGITPGAYRSTYRKV